jgi:hypothetical protein
MTVLGLCSGCGSNRFHISGNVTYNGKSIEDGTIEFVPVEGTAGSTIGAPINEGRYECLQDVSLVRGGRYQVRISALAKTGKTTPNIVVPGGPPLELSQNYIPAKYNSNSTLTVTLASDSATNTFDFQLRTN